jgi:hypothetical protein
MEIEYMYKLRVWQQLQGVTGICVFAYVVVDWGQWSVFLQRAAE